METKTNPDGKIMYNLGRDNLIDHSFLGMQKENTPSWFITYKDNQFWCEEKYALPYLKNIDAWKERIKTELERFKNELGSNQT